MFGSPIIGVSLGGACTMKFRRKHPDGFLVHTRELEPRSLYIIDEEARKDWQHSIAPQKEERISVTMRVLAKSRLNRTQGAAADAGPKTSAPQAPDVETEE